MFQNRYLSNEESIFADYSRAQPTILSMEKYAPVCISSSGNQTTLQIDVTTDLEQVSNATTVLVPHSLTSDADVVTTATGMHCQNVEIVLSLLSLCFVPAGNRFFNIHAYQTIQCSTSDGI